MDARRGWYTLVWRFSLCRWWRVADLARFCAWAPLQRVRGYPARAQPGDERCLWHHSPPQLSRIARQLAGVGSRLPIGRRRAAYGAHYSAVSGAHTRGRELPALGIWPRLRCLLRWHIATDPWTVLRARLPVQTTDRRRMSAHGTLAQIPPMFSCHGVRA